MTAQPSVLAIHRYYWPDTPPYAAILRAVVGHWRREGAETEVFACQPSYKAGVDNERRPRRELVDGSPVRRVSLLTENGRVAKAANMVLFTLAAAVHVLRHRRDVVMCSTSPPVILGFAVSLAARARGAKFVYHCMDLHPEIGALSGDFARPAVYRLMMRLERAACRRAAAIVVLSEDMRQAVIERDASLADRVVVLNNPDLPDFDRASSEGTVPRSKALRVVFTGNLGRFQGLSAVLDGVAQAAADADVELLLMGDGTARRELEAQAEALPAEVAGCVTLLPHGSPAEARALMRSADLGLVTLQPEVIRYAYPSKTMTYLSEGLPVMAGVESGSQLAKTVCEEGIGVVVDPLDAATIRETVANVAANRSSLDDMRIAASSYAAREAALDVVLRRWDDLLDMVLTTSSPRS